MDHYQTLGVSKGATEDQIKSAFRKVARKHHPDVSSSESSMEKFHRAKEAYDVLSDAVQRSAYDQTLADERKIREKRDSGTSKHEERTSDRRTQTGEILRMTMLLNSHRFKDAEAVARSVLRSDPKSAPAYATLAEASRVRGDLDAAARYFAFAAQYAPDNKVYVEKSLVAQEALARREGTTEGLQRNAPFALGAGAFMVLTSAVYVVLAAEPAVLPGVRPISAWPLSLIFMLLIAGLSVGVSLSVGGALDVYDANRGSAVMRVPPATALGAVAVLSFWIALMFYVLVGATQNAFNASMSRLIGSVCLTVVVFTIAAYNLSETASAQTFLWGGNLVYLSAAVGWFVADSLKR